MDEINEMSKLIDKKEDVQMRKYNYAKRFLVMMLAVAMVVTMIPETAETVLANGPVEAILAADGSAVLESGGMLTPEKKEGTVSSGDSDVSGGSSVREVFSGEFRYENPLDSLDGLLHLTDQTKDRQTVEIVEIDGRKALHFAGNIIDDNTVNDGNIWIIDTNANLPAEAIIEFDMKLVRASNNSSKGGFLFGAALDAAQEKVEKQTWFAAQDIDNIRFRKTGAGDSIFASKNVQENVWQHWCVKYKGSDMVVTVDGEEEYNGQLPGGQSAEAGLAGFTMWSQGDTYVDNFVAREYEELPSTEDGEDSLVNAHMISNGMVEAALDKTFPQVLRYRLLSNNGELFAGYSNAEHVAYITDNAAQEGTPYEAEVTGFEPSESGAVYTLSIPGFHGGLEVTYSFELAGNELVKKITGIAGKGEPYLVSFKLDTPVLRVKSTQDEAQIAHNVERSPDRFNNYVGDQDGDVIGMLKDQGNAARLTDWAFLYTSGVLGTAYNTLIDIPYTIKVTGNSGLKQAALYDREYYYRLAYQPNEDAAGVKKLGDMKLVDTEEEYVSRVLITGDDNGNGKIDWQDGALWVREQLPEMNERLEGFLAAGGTWQQGHGTFPYNTTSSEVKIPYSVWASEARKMYYLTDGTPQAFAIAGWQQHGHDWHWGDWEQTISPGAGGEEGAFKAYHDALKYSSTVSFHMNQEIVTPDAKTYDVNVVARKANGDEQLYNNIFGQATFRNKSYFLDWTAGNTEKRMRKFFTEQYWAPVILYNDQMWDNDSPYNSVFGIHESFAKKKIIDLYKEYGVSICIEGLQPTMIRNGVVQWKYHDMTSTITSFVVAGFGTAQMNSNDPYYQIFGAKVSSNGRCGNICNTPDFNRAIEDHYLYAAPTSFLRQFTAEEYIDNSEMQAVRWSDNVMSKYLKASQTLEFTWGDMVVVSGNNRFIPDLETPESKIHVYSQNGMADEWLLPASWAEVGQVDQYELTGNGQVYIERLDVKDGKVAPVCSAKVPYILVPAEAVEPAPGAVNMSVGANSDALEATDGDSSTIWTASNTAPVITIDWGHEVECNRVEIEEEGQNIKGFRIEAQQDGEWKAVAEGEAAGAKKQILFPSVLTDKLRLVVTMASAAPEIKEVKVFADANLSLTASPSASSSRNYTSVHPDDAGVSVTYTHHADAYSAADDAQDTMWMANGTRNQYLDMAFGRPCKINRVVLREAGNHITSFRIQGQNDGVWADLYNGTTVGELLEINFPVSTAEKIRLLVESADDMPCITEFGIYSVGLVNEAAIAKGNLALKKPASQSSIYDHAFNPCADKAVDGNTNPDWNGQSIAGTAHTDVGAWWQVDLEDTYDIGAIKIYSRNVCQDRIARVNVSVLDEEGNVVWTTFMKDAPAVSTTLKVEGEDGTVVSGRYVKIQHPDDIGEYPLEFAECEVYEKTDEVDVVDKKALQELYDDCITYEEEIYTLESWKVFQDALDASEAALESNTVTNAEVEKISRDLFYAREHLVQKEGDKTELAALLEKAKAEEKKTDKYTAESLEALQAAIEKTEAEWNTITTITDVRNAVKRLQTAIDMLKEDSEPLLDPRAILQDTYDYGLTLDTAGVVESAVKIFEDAMKRTEDVLADNSAAGAQILDAWENLVDAIHGLGLLQGDKSALGILIDRAELMVAEKEKYVPSTWQQLLDALAAAKEVMGDGDAMKEDVVSVSDILLKAIHVQRYQARKDILEELINDANGIDESLYTDDSAAGFRTALAAATSVLNDKNLSEDDQKIVDDAADGLNKAILALVEKEDNNETGGDDNGSDNGTGDDSKGGDINNSETGNDGSGVDDGQSDVSLKAPKTGDSQPFGLLIALMALGALAAAGGIVSIYRRKKSSSEK